MKKEKEILKTLTNNDALYEAIYCAIVSDNDFIKELKNEIKSCKKDLKNNDIFISVEYMQSHIKETQEQLKEYQSKRRQLKKACYLLFGDDMSDYND